MWKTSSSENTPTSDCQNLRMNHCITFHVLNPSLKPIFKVNEFFVETAYGICCMMSISCFNSEQIDASWRIYFEIFSIEVFPSPLSDCLELLFLNFLTQQLRFCILKHIYNNLVKFEYEGHWLKTR